MLTGRPPFKGTTPLSTLAQVVSQEPPSPRSIERHVPRDLETICLKCLEKDPLKRYRSAAQLADDLGRFLAGRPILARPIGALGQAWKWARRRPAEACLALSVFMITCIGLWGILWQWRHALAERDAARRQWYRANMVAAAAALQIHNSPALERTLDSAPSELRQWEWRYFRSQLDKASKVLAGHQGPVIGVAFSPDGGRVASISQDRTMRLWRVATGQEIAVALHQGAAGSIAFSPDGHRVASGSDDGTVRLWDGHSGLSLGVYPGRAGPITITFSPDGRWLASADSRGGDIWDAPTGRIARYCPPGSIPRVAWPSARTAPESCAARTTSSISRAQPPAIFCWRRASRVRAFFAAPSAPTAGGS